MKIAVSGKGGVGKTTLVAMLAKLFAKDGLKVFAIDADPDTNLARSLGFPHAEKITSLIQMKELIEERTGAKKEVADSYFKLNPRVDDIPEKYFVHHEGINLAVMGTVRAGGAGCTCRENAFLKALLRHLILQRKEIVILDMEAGIEHLGRGTCEAIDKLIIVVEPGRRSIETAQRIRNLAREIGLKDIKIVGNKIRNEEDKKFILESLKDFSILGFIPYCEEIIEADMKNISLPEAYPQMLEQGKKIMAKLN